MTMPPPVNVIVGEMLDSVQAIRAYTRGLSREEFIARPMVQDAVLRRFEILGEAAKSLPPEWRQQHAEVPWRRIIDTRNRLIHGYFSVNVYLAWEAIERDIPELEEQLRQIAGR
jgi:uncharacterized protein with HEPN domain